MIGMDYYQGGGASHSQGSPFVGYEQHEEWRQQEQEQGGLPVSSSANTSGLEEAMWGLSLQSSSDQGMEMAAGPYPERPGEQDCVYYMRTGLCAFGMSCKFNHPPNRKLAAAIARGKGEYPERPGQPECQYFLKTGTCKFGATCKYDHPREKAAIQSRVQLNMIGFPYRPGEKDCAYYMRTGACKYGVTCKFHHPQPAVVPSSALFPGASQNSPVANQQQQHTHSSQQHYQSGWPVRPFPSPRLQAGASSYTPLLLPSPASVVSIPGWSTYHEGHHQPQALYLPGSSGAGAAELGSFSPYLPASPTMGLPATLSQQHKEYSFPERPGEPECQYYLKTGDCKFGSNCRFHHPRDRVPSTGATLLSPMGLPLRSGVQPCNYYVRFGICKFGPTCKFDHPLAAIYGFGPTLNYTNLPSTTKSAATISLVELHDNSSNSSTSTSAVPSGALDSSARKEEIPTG